MAGPRADLATLTGPHARDLLQAAVRSAAGELVSLRPRQVDHRPHRPGRVASTTVAYAARVRWPDGEKLETLVASTATVPTSDGVLLVSDGSTTFSIWRRRDDPELPGLRTALQSSALLALLAEHGIRSTARVRLKVKTYRPRRRSVIEVTCGPRRLFLKVVRPKSVAGLHARHVLLHNAGVPVPQSLGWTSQGILLLAAIPGESLRSQLRDRQPAPTGPQLLAVLDKLPAAVQDLPARPSWADNAAHYGEILAASLPAESTRAHDLSAAIVEGLRTGPMTDATHGDFYEAQLLITANGEVSGLLDVDSAGPGRRADDLACLLAHTNLLAAIEPAHRASTLDVAEGWRMAFLRSGMDRQDLQLRVAGVLMSLATGPYRVQNPAWPTASKLRLDLVEQWVSSAQD